MKICRKIPVGLALLFLLTIFSSAQQIDLEAPIPIDPKVKIGKLENGLTYYLRKNNKPEDKVELRLAINVGSLQERDDQQGLAHFLEHMAFNGTTSFGRYELDSYLRSIGVQSGAHSNAYTSFDETVYKLSIPTRDKDVLGKGLLILSEWASGITLAPNAIDKERGVVLEEMRIGQGADERMRAKYYPKLFKDSRYSLRLPIGKKEVLEKFRHQALRDFYEDWYRPALMVVVAVGDLDIQETEKKIRELFSGISQKRKNVPLREAFDVPDHDETLIAIATDKEATSTYAEVYIKRDQIPQKKLRDLKTRIARTFFNWMLNERINEIVEQPSSPFVEGYAGFSSLVRVKDSYVIYGDTNPKSIKKTLETLLAENKRAEKFGFTSTELERQKKDYLVYIENEFNERENTESSDYVSSYVANYLSGFPIEGIEFGFEFAKKVVPTITIEDVNALVKDSISTKNRVVIISGPEKDKNGYPTEAEIVNILAKAETIKVKPYVDKITDEPLVAELPVKVSVARRSTEEKLGITRWELSNGIKFILKPTDFKKDEILLRGISPGGVSTVSNEKIIPAIHASAIANESGVKGMTESQIVKKLAGKNISANTGISSLYERVDGSSTPKDFEALLQMVYLRITDVNFNERSFRSYVNKDKVYYQNLLSDPEVYFGHQVSRIVANNHPRFVSPYDLTQYDKLQLGDVQEFYKTRFADLSDFTFMLVGNFDPEAIEPLILKYFGNLPTGNRRENWRDVDWRGQKGPFKRIIRKGIEQKSRVSISYYKEVPYDNRDRYLVYILGNLLNLKLTKVLREEKSGVYGVSASASIAKNPYTRFSLDISFPCAPENVDLLTKTTVAEIRKIRSGQIDQKDVEKIQEIQRVAVRESRKTNSSWIGRIESSIRYGIDILTDDQVDSRINSITKEEIERVAKKYIDLDKRVEFVLMPEKRTEVKKNIIKSRGR